MPSTVRITSEHVGSPQFQGQSIRAVGMLVAVDAGAGKVQLQLAGGEGAPRTIFFINRLTARSKPCCRARGVAALAPISTHPSPVARALRRLSHRAFLTHMHAGSPTTITCTEGTQKYLLETVGKGYYEVIGTLGSDGCIAEMKSSYFGENFDTGMYAEMVKLSHNFPDIF